MRLKVSFLVFFITPITLLFFSCQKKFTTPQDTSQQPPDSLTLEQVQQMVKTGLWASYTFSKGSFADQSGNHHDLTPSSGVKTTYDLTGNPGEAIELDGPNDYVLINDGKNFPDGDFSVCFTIMPTSTSGTIFGKGDVANNKGYSFSTGFDDINHNHTLLFATNKTSDPCSNPFNINTATTASGSRVISTDGSWYYVVITYHDGEEQMYINNRLELDLKTSSDALKHCPSAPFYIGVPSATGIPSFTGKIDNLNIYTRVLTPREVQYFYFFYK
jgi:Concanavalin A-like lectin/glucanases superfamily